MALNVQQIDDTDTRIRYSGRWEAAGNPDEYNMTTHGTNSAGAQAEFVFNGTSVAVYGTIEAKSDSIFSAVSMYTIDGSSPTPNVGMPGNNILYNQLLYRSLNLADGQHTLIITSTLGGGSMLWLDYLQVVPSRTSPSISAVALPSSPFSTSVRTSGSLDLPTSTPLAEPRSGHSSIGSGAIAGIAVGGFFCLLLSLVLVWLWQRKARPIRFNEKSAPSTPSLPFWEKPKRISIEVTPFNLASPPATPATHQSYFHRSDAPSTITTTITSPSHNQGNGYSIGTTLVEKRGLGANHSIAPNSQATDRLSISQTLVTASSPTAFSPTDILGSGPSNVNHVPRQHLVPPTKIESSDDPPAYA
ncbi:hypothetical protein BDZ94DRAFT_146921 [Collybia nuda]|uniref:Uncharacterized protein n=1 Tax=Collybia nuda TaxID=64659 RepID=A0A9P6CA71_9AGAR|nr:hypothetical protein BDZ94DRAFT_146921 [Collybia nuda]